MRYLTLALLIAIVFVGCQNPQYQPYPYQPPRHHYDYERPHHYYDDGIYDWYDERYSYRDVERDGLIREHNVIRYNQRLGALRTSQELTRAAQEQAEWMARIRTLTHKDANGATVGHRVRGNWKYVGENIAFGYNDGKKTMDAWMRSADHHKNIVNPHYSHAGAGIAEDNNGVRYWCVIFGG